MRLGSSERGTERPFAAVYLRGYDLYIDKASLASSIHRSARCRPISLRAAAPCHIPFRTRFFMRFTPRTVLAALVPGNSRGEVSEFGQPSGILSPVGSR